MRNILHPPHGVSHPTCPNNPELKDWVRDQSKLPTARADRETPTLLNSRDKCKCCKPRPTPLARHIMCGGEREKLLSPTVTSAFLHLTASRRYSGFAVCCSSSNADSRTATSQRYAIDSSFSSFSAKAIVMINQYQHVSRRGGEASVLVNDTYSTNSDAWLFTHTHLQLLQPFEVYLADPYAKTDINYQAFPCLMKLWIWLLRSGHVLGRNCFTRKGIYMSIAL